MISPECPRYSTNNSTLPCLNLKISQHVSCGGFDLIVFQQLIFSSESLSQCSTKTWTFTDFWSSLSVQPSVHSYSATSFRHLTPLNLTVCPQLLETTVLSFHPVLVSSKYLRAKSQCDLMSRLIVSHFSSFNVLYSLLSNCENLFKNIVFYF